MTGWGIEWSHQAIRDVEKLDPKIAKRIIRKLEEAAENPAHFFSRLSGHDDYKLRIGDYRLLALLSYETTTILVERVDHRSRIYRALE